MASYAEWAARLRVRVHLPLGILYLLLARPTTEALGAAGGLVVLGLVVRAWAAGHLQKESGITLSGPYAHHRHPLYLGTAIILAGLAVASANPWAAALMAGYFLLFYPATMRREEEERAGHSPDLYALYRALVPAALPRLRPVRFRQPQAQAGRRFGFRRFLANSEWRAGAGCAALLLLLYTKMVLQ